MITDKIENAPRYFNLSPRITTALKYLMEPNRMAIPLGRHELDGDRIYALVMEYTSKPPSECYYESHKNYTDVQFIAAGAESIGWAPIQTMRQTKPYEAERDLLVYEGPGQDIRMQHGSFAIFMPHDVHMPCVATDGKPVNVRKIVVKVAVE